MIWEDYKKHLLREGLSQLRIKKLKVMYNLTNKHLPIPLENAARQHLEEFVDNLNSNKIKKANGKNLSGWTKHDLKRFLKQFFRWYKGESEYDPIETRWIKARISKDEQPEEKPIIGIEEAKKVSNAFRKIEFRILTLLLFDSGFRISEMLSVKKRDITWEEYDEGEYCFWINCNVSKTLTRKVPIPIFTEDIKAFVNSSFFEGLGEDGKVFDVSYRSFSKSMNKASLKMLGKKLSPHCFRHSSATYYSKVFEGNMNMLAERYGWTFSSKQLKTYIRRSGAYQKIGAKKAFSNEVTKLRERVEKLENIIKRLEPHIVRLIKD